MAWQGTIRSTMMALALLLLAGCAAAGTHRTEPPAPPRYDDMFGAWSPDGKRIAFMSDRSGDYEIYVADADGSHLRQLTYAPGRDAHPSWAPDGKSLLFQSPRETGDIRLFRMNDDGSDQRSLAPTTGFCGVPVWSPEGTRIALQCSPLLGKFGTPESPWRLFLLEPGSSELRPISNGPGNDQVPNWAPDGKTLLFFSDRGGNNQLYELTLATGAVTELTSGSGSHIGGSYSPDGRSIALIRISGNAKEIAVLRKPDSFTTVAALESEFTGASFSPDGKQLIANMPTPNGSRLFVIPSDGSATPRAIEFREP